MSGDESDSDKTEALAAALSARMSGERRGPPSTASPQASMDQAAYDRWFPPLVAIKKLEAVLLESEAKREIHRRICEGEILSVARTTNWYSSDGIEVRDYVRLGGFLWKFNPEPNWYDLLWKTGSHTLSRPEYPSTRTYPVECFGIRFDPAGIGTILIDGGVTAPTQVQVETEDRPPVSRVDLARWHEIFKALHPTAVEAVAIHSAAAMFPDKHVPRQWVRDLRGAQKRGKPRKTND